MGGGGGVIFDNCSMLGNIFQAELGVGWGGHGTLKDGNPS